MSLSIEKKQSNIKHNLVPRFYILSVVVTAFFFLISSFAVGQEAQAVVVDCPTDNGNGVGCADAAYPYYCNGACKSAAEAPTCVGGWEAQSAPSIPCATGHGIDCTNFATADACGYAADCNSGYTRCGAWKEYTCIATIAPISPCASQDTCNNTCTSCISGYGLWNGTCSTLTLKLGYDSVSGNSLIQSLAYPSLFIPVSGYVGIGTSTPNDLLTIGANTTLPANQSTIGTGHNSTQTYSSDDSYALTNVGYVQAVASAIILGTATSTATTSMTTIAKFSVVSVSANGSNDGIKGYARANTLCKDAVTDSHVCTSFEILFSIAAGVTMPNENVWIFNGPPGYTASSNDCEGRTSAAASSYGAYWEKPTSPSYPQGRGLLGRCNTSLKLACCK
jgi:hypothetical protein